MQIPVETLVKMLNQIPGIAVTIQYDTSEKVPGLHPGMTFEAYSYYWLWHYKCGQVKGNTFQCTYQEPLELHLIPYFGGMQIQNIAAADIRAFFDLKVSEGYALETLYKMRNALNAIFETALENHLCFCNPVTTTLKLHSTTPPVEKHCWTREEYETAYNFADGHPKGLGIQILLETGMSRSELLGLQWSDHNVATRELSVNHGLVYLKDPQTGKSGLVHDGLKNKYRHRLLPISDRLNARLALEPRAVTSHKKVVKTDFIIHAPRGGPYWPRNWYEREFKPFMHDLLEEYPDLPPLTTHELRHTVATVCANKNISLHWVAQLLGQCDLDMLSKRYLHPDITSLRGALGR